MKTFSSVWKDFRWWSVGIWHLSKSLTESSVGRGSLDYPVDLSVSLPYFQSVSFHIKCCGVYEEFLLSYFIDKSIFHVESLIY